jgi:hypothetical protein
VRTDNLTVKESAMQEINLTSGGVKETVWHAHVVSPKSPWVAVLIPDDTVSSRRELTGSEIPTFVSESAQSRSKAP